MILLSRSIGLGADAGAAGPRHKTIRLADYRPPAWLVETTDLTFDLKADATRVTARLAFRRNPEGPAAEGARPDLTLDGHSMTLIRAAINGVTLSPQDYSLSDSGLLVPGANLPGDAFEWECETEVNPSANTALEGLYLSRSVYCTQCEAQGFRKITYFPDRPDVMSVYSTRIEADKAAQPILLSNGNPTASGDLANGRHFVEWRDPFPKPCYLFALVAGELTPSSDVFDTASGRRVDLKLFTRPGDETKASYALDALKRSMRWDEEVYGFEYDLDLFMIVAVDDFNMGAMENKGLNVFNSRYVLASPDTATDRDYELIESVVAHEYFHNWTGNRITCRDWFQLCLKEGLTVFRDQTFTEDERSAAVARIDTVKALRARQFREDAGPLAHPVRPESYVEINNFYTATVYEKGAEIVRMLHTLLGAELYRKALDLYVERHDGQAATLEQFLACFESVAGQDLQQFKLWWTQSGTPRVTVEERWDEAAGVYSMTLSQSTPPTPGQKEKAPQVTPLKVGLIGGDGVEVPLPGADGKHAPGGRLCVLDKPRKAWRFEGLKPGAANRPVLSINRGFSAPVIIERKDVSEARLAAERATLLAHDSDPFNRWEAGRGLAVATILGVMKAGEGGAETAAQAMAEHCGRLSNALGAALRDDAIDPSFKALLFALPGEDELAGEIASTGSKPADPDAIHAARTHVRLSLAEALRKPLLECYAAMETPGPYDPCAADAGKRALKNTALGLLAQLRDEETLALAEKQFRQADNMTDRLPALVSLVHVGADRHEEALQSFYDTWREDSLVLGKWFGVQATSPLEDSLDKVIELTEHPAFEWRNPNKFRALIGAFAMGNTVNFHRKDGAGYRFLTDWLIKLDPVNPQTAAKIAGAFETWRRYDEIRRNLIRDQLERLLAVDDLSKDVTEIVTRILGEDR